MEIQIRHNPSFSVARCILGASEPLKVEAGAMVAWAPDVTIESKAEGGVMKSLKRAALGGESFFMTTAHAGPSGGWADVAPVLPGDIGTMTIDPGRAFFISKGSWLASEAGVNIETQWGGMKNLFGGEGGFLVRAEGQGQVLYSCYGALDRMTLQPGQTVVVDTGHMVAFDETVSMELTKAASGLIKSVKSGEGLVFRFTGPGELLMQTRSPNVFIDWLTTALPFTRS